MSTPIPSSISGSQTGGLAPQGHAPQPDDPHAEELGLQGEPPVEPGDAAPDALPGPVRPAPPRAELTPPGAGIKRFANNTGVAKGYVGAVADSNTAILSALSKAGNISDKSTAYIRSSSGTGMAGSIMGVFSSLAGLASKAFSFHTARIDKQQAMAGAAAFERQSQALERARDDLRQGKPGSSQQAVDAARQALSGQDAADWLRHDRAAKATDKLALATDAAGAGRGLLQGSVGIAKTAAKFGAHVAGNFAKTVAPGIGIASGGIGLALSGKALYQNYQDAKAQAAKAARLDAAAMQLAPADADQAGSMAAALSNVRQHAGTSLEHAKTAGRWKLFGNILGAVGSALGIASNALVLSGVGAVAGIVLGAISAGISAATFVCAVREEAHTRIQATEAARLKAEVASPAQLQQTLADLQGPPVNRSEAAAKDHLASTNHIYAVMQLAEKLGAGNAAERDQALAFLATAGMGPTMVDTIEATTAHGGPVAPDSPAVVALSRFFGL